MKTLCGKASGVQHGTTTSGVLLEVEGQRVTILLREPVAISEGDEVFVAGLEKRGIVWGLAYRNRTRGVIGKSQIAMQFIVGALLCCSVLLLPYGLLGLHTAYRNQKAYRAVA